ncbi:MAG TPA: response regulator, partial [Actinomycetes bacterium]|nr:response regulator [Actinomycetes bacterium]
RAKVSVFVELYLKNRQLLEQAELLRGQLADPARNAIGADLMQRLRSVEDQLELVASQAKVTVDPTMSDQVAELADRVTRLRDGIEALQPRS